MKQYHQLLKDILERGTHKPAARENMPGTLSLFGYQNKYNLQDGFPLVTTKPIYWKGIVIELLWFLRGDTNIKFLDENGVRKLWHEDAYNYYKKIASKNTDRSWNNIYMPCKGNERDLTLRNEKSQITSYSMLTFEEFCSVIKEFTLEDLKSGFSCHEYTLGDCGVQYGKLWRDWDGITSPQILKLKSDNALSIEQVEKFKQAWEHSLEKHKPMIVSGDIDVQYISKSVDQLKELIKGLKNNPMSRRHIITAWNPVTLDDMALNACHALVQFNCRPIPWEIKLEMAKRNPNVEMENLAITEAASGHPHWNIPQYYLDCQLYQRSADVVLGVPYNIASYALLTEIICRVCNMIPGELIHTFGDVHIYGNHLEAVKEQLEREPRELPRLNINTEFWLYEGEQGESLLSTDGFLTGLQNDNFIKCLIESDIQLSNYNPHPKLKSPTELSTGLKK
jgi:thymidylate synthase